MKTTDKNAYDIVSTNKCFFLQAKSWDEGEIKIVAKNKLGVGVSKTTLTLVERDDYRFVPCHFFEGFSRALLDLGASRPMGKEARGQ